MPWICTLLMACLLVPSGLVAQTEADRESVNLVVQRLLADAGQLGDEIPHSPGAWSLVIARFAEGDSREVRIPARAGEEYLVSGYAESHRADVDICVYDPAGDPVDCDTLMDRYPVAAFTAKTEGAYRAVMTAASVEGGGTSFAGMIVVKVVPDRGADPFGESNDGRTPVDSALRFGAEPTIMLKMLDAGAGEHLKTLAASQAPESVPSALSNAGADPNAQEVEGGRTPVRKAIWVRESALLPAVSALPVGGADPGSSRGAVPKMATTPRALPAISAAARPGWHLVVPERTLAHRLFRAARFVRPARSPSPPWEARKKKHRTPPTPKGQPSVKAGQPQIIG